MSEACVHIGPCSIDLERQRLRVNGKHVATPSAEFGILKALVTSDTALTASDVIAAAGSDAPADGTNLAAVYISRLRAKLPIPIVTSRIGRKASYWLDTAYDTSREEAFA